MRKFGSRFGGNKYGVKKTKGILFGEERTFGSPMELEYGKYIEDLCNQGKVTEVELQKPFILQPAFTDRNGKKHLAIKYVSDFSFKIVGTDYQTVIDTKGMATTDGKMKYKMMLHKYPEIDFRWVCKYKGEWVDWFDNEKRKSKNRIEKKKLMEEEIDE